jgi:predicted SnoaL-like aldol condensation-catalyzing enzyme/quinol monooxygenase YgiN
MNKKSSELLGIARFKIHKGKLEEFKRLSTQAMEIARTKDTGTLQYDIYINEEKSEAVVIERYKDSASLREHLTNNSDVAKEIFLTGSVSGELLGEPSAELKAMLAGAPVGLFKPFLSISMSKKETATEFLKLASSGKVKEAYDKYVHPDFKHHNAYYKGDRETLLKGMEENAKQFPNKKYETLRTLEDRDLVTVHGKVSNVFGKNWSVIHIFRFEDNKIIEEWEASQEDIKDSPNGNGIF